MTLRDWLSLGMFLITVLLVPLVRAGWKGELATLRAEWQEEIRKVREESMRLLEVHNAFSYAHPNLLAVDKLERRLEAINEKLDELLEKVSNITPRRRAGDGD